MAQKHLTYLDIPANRRRITAAKNLARLKESVGNPALTPEQLEAIKNRINHLHQWASGTIPNTEHSVEVTETVEVSED
jgi:chorismate mutase